MLTYVTALFHDASNTHRFAKDYFKYFESLASTRVSIIFFLDPFFQDTDDVHRIIKYYNNVRIEWLVLDMSYTKLWNEPIQLPSSRNTNKDTMIYLCIQLMKLKCLMLSTSITDSKYLAWIDCGIFHMIKDVKTAQKRIQGFFNWEFPKDKIIAPRCCPLCISHDLLNYVCWYFAGSFFIGHRSLFERAYTKQMELVQNHQPHLTWEINYWYMMRDDFSTYDANHNDSILDIPSSFNLASP